VHIVYHLMANSYTFSCLLKSFSMFVNLGKNSTILKLELSNNKYLAHAIGDTLFLEVNQTHRKMFERMLYALGTLFKHLHLLVAQSHIVEHNKQMV